MGVGEAGRKVTHTHTLVRPSLPPVRETGSGVAQPRVGMVQESHRGGAHARALKLFGWFQGCTPRGASERGVELRLF